MTTTSKPAQPKYGTQADDDFAIVGENGVFRIDVLCNDDGGPSQSLWSLDQKDIGRQTAAGTKVTLDGGAQVWFQNGAVMFDTRGAFDKLALGQFAVECFTYAIRTGGVVSYATVRLLVVGTNDAPVAHADVGRTGENAGLTLDVLANDKDVDAGARLTLKEAAAPPGKGKASIVGNKLVFDPGTDFDRLAAAATEQVVVTYKVVDEWGAPGTSTATITILGQNDAPRITGYRAPAVVAELPDGDAAELTGSQRAEATITVADPDAGDTHRLEVAALGDGYLGTVSLVRAAGSSPGSAEVRAVLDMPNAETDALAAGETLTQSYRVTITDAAGATATRDVAFTITGTNDAPTVSGAVMGTATEDGPAVRLDALANAADVDRGAVLAVADLPSVLPPGVTFDAAARSFALDPAAYQSLGAGETKVVTVAYQVTDGTAETPASVSWTVFGANDAPLIVAAGTSATASIVEAADHGSGPGVTHERTGVIAFTDADAGDTHLGSVTALGEGYLGTLTLGAVDQAGDTLGWTFTVDDRALDFLPRGATVTQSYDVAIADGKGGVAHQTVQVTLTETPDGLDLGFEKGGIGWEVIGNVEFVEGGTQGSTMAAVQVIRGADQADVEAFLGVASGALDRVNGGDAVNGSAIKGTVRLEAGQTLSFDWFWDGGDYMPYNDFAFWAVQPGGGLVKLADIATFGRFGDSGWRTAGFTATASGDYLIELGAMNVKDPGGNAGGLYLDNFVIL